MSRCVSFLLDEGTSQEQAVAICTSQYRSEKLKTMAWKTIDRKRASYIKHAKTQFSRALKAQANEYLDKVKANGLSEEYTISAEPIEKAMRNVYQRVMTQFARDTYNDLIEEAKKTQTNWEATVDRWFDDNVIDLSDLMTDTTAKSVRDIARDAIVEGKSIREFQNDLMASYSVSERRAELIGRTEIIRASNAGSLLGAEETGIPMKKYWLATRDNRTRGLNPKDIFDHYSMDENKGLPLDQAFNVSGEQLQHPGDRAGSPGNTINCRCTMTYEVIEEGVEDFEAEEPTQVANDPNAKPIFDAMQYDTEEGRRLRFTTWRDRMLETKDPESIAEAFLHWSDYRFAEYKEDFATGNFKTKTAKLMKEGFDNFDGNHKGSKIFRGLNFDLDEVNNPDDIVNYFNTLKIGDILEDSTPLSFSTNKNVAIGFAEGKGYAEKNFSVMIELDGVTKNGFDLKGIQITDEDEVVLRPGSKLKIVNIRREKLRPHHSEEVIVIELTES